MPEGLTFGPAAVTAGSDNGLNFSGTLPPPSVPPDPTGEDWRGEPGATGPQGPQGPPGSVLDFASPPPIGSTAPNTGRFTTLNTTGAASFGSTVAAVGPLTLGAGGAGSAAIIQSGTGNFTFTLGGSAGILNFRSSALASILQIGGTASNITPRKPIVLTGPYAITGAPQSDAALYMNQTWTGSAAIAQSAQIFLQSVENVSVSGDGSLAGLYVKMTGSGAGILGNRQAGFLQYVLSSVPTDVGTGAAYNALNIKTDMMVGAGGTALDMVNTLGTTFGFNPVVHLGPLCQFWRGAICTEFDVWNEPGSSVMDRVGLAVVLIDNSTGTVARNNIALTFNNQGIEGATSNGWKTLIALGKEGGHIPLASDGIIMRYIKHDVGIASPTIGGGIDLTGLTISGNAFASPGFAVNGAGNVNVAGTASFGTGSTNHIDVIGGNSPTIQVVGSFANGSMILRSKGLGPVRLGSETAGNILRLNPAASGTGGDVLLVTQPVASGTPILFGTNNASGFNFNGGPLNVNRTLAYSGLTSAVANKTYTVASTIGGFSTDAAAFTIGKFENTFTNFKAGEGLFVNQFTSHIGTGSAVVQVALRVDANQSSQPLTLADIAWQPSHAYATLGDIVRNGTGIYMVTVAGTSAASGGPTGSGGAIVDGTVTWRYARGAQAMQQSVGMGLQGSGSFNVGGTATGRSGLVWGAVLGSFVAAPATYYSSSTTLELDDWVNNTSISRSTTLALVKTGFQGNDLDVGIHFNAVADHWRNPIIFDGAVDPHGVGFSAASPSVGGLQAMAGFLDCLMVNATGSNTQPGWKVTGGGGYILRGPNAQLRGNGDLQIGNAGFSISANTLTLDTTYQVLSAVGALSGGTLWTNGDLAVDDFGNVAGVTAVAGVPTALSIAGQPKTYVATASIPGGAVTWHPMHASKFLNDTGEAVTADTFTTASETYTAGTTLNFGTGAATIINIGRTASLTTFAGKLKSALLTNAANDAAAASAGVGVGEFYRNASVVMQRAA